MKLTRKQAAAIKASIHELVGYPVRCEVGLRCDAAETWAPNALLWADEADLEDHSPLHRLGEFAVADDGRVVLDVYVYYQAPHFMAPDLDQNVSVEIEADGSFVTRFDYYGKVTAREGA